MGTTITYMQRRVAGTGECISLRCKGGGMAATSRSIRRAGLFRQVALGLTLGLVAAAFFLATSSSYAELVTKEEIRAAEQKADRTEDALDDARRVLKKQNSVLEKADRAVRRSEASLTSLQEKLAAADKDEKAALAEKIRTQQEEVNRTRQERAAAQADADRAQQQAAALEKDLATAETECADLKARQKREAAEWKTRGAEVKTMAAAPTPAVVPAPVAQAAPAVQPAPVLAAPALVAAAPAASSDTIGRLQEEVNQAQARKAQADAVVKQRADDLEKAKDAEARKKAATALSEAEKYAQKQDKEYQKAVAELEKARQPAPERLAFKRFHRETTVSEPAPWAPPAPPEPAPTLRGDQELTTPAAQPGDIAPAGTKLQFDVPMIAGDKEIVQDLDVWKEWADYITFSPVTAEEINEFHGKLTKALQEKGYVFAKVTFPTRIWAYGIFLAKVDCGPLGTITVKGNRHYSERQIIRALADQDGSRFNYARVHGDLFDLNAKPDLNIDAKLRPEIQDGRRVINADLEVDDDLPLHGAFEISNTGTKETHDWRMRTTLQHVNLTKNDDVFTLDWLTSPRISDLNAFSGAYFLPIDDLYSLNVFAGYSDSDVTDIMPLLDVRGKGYYGGAQLTRTLSETATYRSQLTLGWFYQSQETEQDIGGATWDTRKLEISMPSLTYGYASRVFDSLSGRNFLSATLQANFAGNFGSSDKEEFVGQGGRGTADGDFTMLKFQVARMQRFFRGEDEPGKWTVFMKVDGQLAGDTLPAAVRRSVGGANSVRGYEESELSADNAVVATVELRTPLFRNFIPGLKKDEEFLEMNPEAWQQHRLQFIAFVDAGWLENKEPLAGEMENETLLSAGLGLRLGLTKYSQMRLDYGYPLEETTEDTPSSGRFHLSMQLQF